MLQEEHSAILSTFIKLPFVIKFFFCLFLSGRLRQVLLYVRILHLMQLGATVKHVSPNTQYINRHTMYTVLIDIHAIQLQYLLADVLEFQTIVASQKGINKQHGRRSK